MKKRLGKGIMTVFLTASMVLSGLNMAPAQVQAAASQYTGTHFEDGLDYYDTGKWHKAEDYSNGDMFYCTWRDANVAFNNGEMELKILSDDWQTEYSRYSGGEYRTNQAFHYGMYQVNMKPIKNDGVVTSFFTYTGPADGTNWDEIDIEFLGKDTTKVQFNYYTNGVGGHEYVYNLGFDASKGYHTYGFYWADDYIAWYVDGSEVYRTPSSEAGIIPDEPSRIMMNAWPGKGVDDWLNPYNGVTPLTAYYDWMAWDAAGTGDSGSDDSDTSTDNGSSGGNTEGDIYTDGQAQFDGNRIYKITSKVSGKAVDVEWGNPENGTNVLQYTYSGYANQQWYLKKQTNNYYTIENLATGKVLSVQDQSTDNGANVHQWEYVGNANQEWSIWQMADGAYKIINRQSGKCLDLKDSSLADNANIHQWEETAGSQAIYWYIDSAY